MLNLENLFVKISLFFLLVLPTASTFSSERNFSFPSSNEENMCIVDEERVPSEKCSYLVSSRSFDNKTRDIFNKNNEILPIFVKSSGVGKYLLLVARTPSRLPQSTKYCGAGYEDRLILLKYQNKKVRFLDDFLLQSCLKNISLRSDSSNDILKMISVDIDAPSIRFQWLSDPEETSHVIAISNEKFQLH